ncbi:MAG TPA: SH3 domain-containing protein [Smithella sp.]|mgnify:CR=1 FL=1|nr:SH3 domain-containing protein [Smithella sp.]
MDRQPSLAELLSDNRNNIRPEIADLLMQSRQALQAQAARQPVRPPLPQARPRSQSLDRGLTILLLIVLALALAESAIKYFNPSKPGAVEPDEIRKFYRAELLPVPTADEGTGKTGLVIGESVSIRTQPNLQGEVIKTVNQNELLKVISFHNGWYRVALPDQNSGYIFGAYLLPQDFDSHPYHAALAKDDQTKLLVKVDDNPVSYSVLWPDGQTTRILKENVDKHH